MLDAMTVSLKIQHAAIENACCAASGIANMWSRVIRGERALLFWPFHRRSDELHTHTDHIARGANWTDHYGRRSHDVDVEHLR